MRFQTQWLRRVVGVFTLATMLFSIPATNTFAQASLFDPTFKVGHGANGIVYSIVVQDDGKIVVGGEFTQIAGHTRTNLARLNSDGQLDTSFPQGTDGAVYRLLKQPDGKILVGGAFTNLQGSARSGIGRLLTNGNPDLSFNVGTNIAPELAAYSLAFQSDGKVLASLIYPNSPYYAFLRRFDSNGDEDGSFVQTNVFTGWIARAICPWTNGTILVGGGFQKVNGVDQPGLVLLRADGEADSSFQSPLTSGDVMGNHSDVFSIRKLSDDSILIAGRFWPRDTLSRHVIAKLTATLAWDANFQPDGFDFSAGAFFNNVVSDILQQSDGKYILGGLFQEVGGYWRRNVVRLSSGGRVDACFDPGLGLGDFGGFSVTTMAQQSDGKVIVGGIFVCPGGGSVVSLTTSNLTRFLPQSDCDATRVYLGRTASGGCFVAASCAPGGTNYLEVSTNLVDWVTAGAANNPFLPLNYPYLYLDIPDFTTNSGIMFHRVKKEY